MQQLVRTKFMSFELVVPERWQEPAADEKDRFYAAMKPEDRVTQPASPALFRPATLMRAHTDVQRMHTEGYGKLIDETCEIICAGWAEWQKAAALTGVAVAGAVATGGQLVGPSMEALLKPKAKSDPFKIAMVGGFGSGWDAFTKTVRVGGLPWYPAFTAFAGPAAPPTANIPAPFASLIQVPTSLSPPALKQAMASKMSGPGLFASPLFESMAHAIDKCFAAWKSSTTVTNVMGSGAVPTFGAGALAGPVIGNANQVPGGIT